MASYKAFACIIFAATGVLGAAGQSPPLARTPASKPRPQEAEAPLVKGPTVTFGGRKYTLANLQSDHVQLPTGSYTVGLSRAGDAKAELLSELQRTWSSWTPSLRFSAGMPMFVGVLNEMQIISLLQHDNVAYVEAEEFHYIAPVDPAPSQIKKGATVGGKLFTVGALQHGASIPRGTYVVGVDAEAKAPLLAEMHATWSWVPTVDLSGEKPMFAGLLDRKQVTWLLKQESVRFLQHDGATDGNSGEEAALSRGSSGVTIAGEWYSAEELHSGLVRAPTCDYFVQVKLPAKKAVLDQLYMRWGWIPETAFTEQMPLFMGRLNHEQVAYLVDVDAVRFIKTDCDAHFDEAAAPGQHPAALLLDGRLYSAVGARRRSEPLPTGRYVVGLRHGASAESLRQRWGLTVVVDEPELLAGTLSHEAVMAMLLTKEVGFVQKEAMDVAAKAPKAFLAGSP